MKYFFIIIIFLSQIIHAEIDYKKRILFVVGYMDEQPRFSEIVSQPRQLLYRKFHNDLARLINIEIISFLEKNGFTKINSTQYVNDDYVSINVLNVNIDCPAEINQEISKRSMICHQQIEKSQLIMEHLNSGNLKNNEVIIYLGHSRKGMGMAIGPFTPEYTYPLEIYNEREKGKLKKIIYASCSSEKYYQNKILSMGMNFVGTKADMMIFSELLPWALNQLANEID